MGIMELGTSFYMPRFLINHGVSRIYKMPDYTKKPRMSSFTRLGIALLVVGALVVGIGTYYDRGAVSLYGLFLVIAGFVLYFATTIVSRKIRK
jgi:hypothetical protein